MDVTNILFHLIGLAILMGLSAFFSGSETALSALTRPQVERIRSSKRRNSSAIVKFVDEPRRLFITVLFGNILVNMAFVTIVGSLVYHNLFKGRNAGIASVTAILIEVFILLIFGEITPKTYAVRHAERFSMTVSRPLWLFSRLIFPFRKVLRWLTDALLPLFGVGSVADNRGMTSEELSAMVKSMDERGGLVDEEGEIIHNILELHDIEAKEAMVPRTEMICVEVSTTMKEAFDKARKAGYSRLPVYRKEIDNICGIFYVKDMPRWRGSPLETLDITIDNLTIDDFLSKRPVFVKPGSEDEKTLIRNPFFAFAGKKIGPLMREMTKGRHQMAVLLDEYGGVSGLITLENIVEEVLGEIISEDDFLDGHPMIHDTEDPGVFQFSGLVSLRSVNSKLKLDLDESQIDTLGGYIVKLFGSIPKSGDSIRDDLSKVEFQVIEMDGLRVEQVRLRILDSEEGGKRGKRKSGPTPLFILLLLFSLASVAASGGSYQLQVGWLSVSAFSCVLVVALALTAFYAGSETAVISASRARMEMLADEGDKRAIIIKKLLDKPDRMLAIVLVGTNLMTTSAGQAGVILTNYALPGQEGMQKLINTVLMTILILIFCEILPKVVFRAKADALALRSAWHLRISAILLHPIVAIVTKLTNLIVKTADIEGPAEFQSMREELRLLATMGEAEGAIGKQQLQMLHRVLALESRSIGQVMVPLVNITAMHQDTRIDDLCRKVAETGFSRIPVYKDRVDNIIGMVDILDIIYYDGEASNISAFVRQDVSYEPESKKVYSLLQELQHSSNPMAFVVDEYGGVIGLVTVEDLVEEIMGEIHDEKDKNSGDIHQISDKVFECSGRAEIIEINQRCGTSIPPGDYETVGGYVSWLAEGIPRQGEFIETDLLRIIVLDSDVRRVLRLRIQKKTESASLAIEGG